MNNNTDTRLAKAMAEITANLTDEINKITADAAKQIKADMVALKIARKKRNVLIGGSIFAGISAACIYYLPLL